MMRHFVSEKRAERQERDIQAKLENVATISRKLPIADSARNDVSQSCSDCTAQQCNAQQLQNAVGAVKAAFKQRAIERKGEKTSQEH